MERIRTFVALPIDASIRAQIKRWTRTLEPDLPTVRWPDADTYHLTLAFLGDVETVDLAPICASLRECASPFSPFALDLEGIGGFPNLASPHVLWVGCGQGVETVRALRAEVVKALYPFGYRDEQRPFAPHLTIGRVKGTLFQSEIEVLQAHPSPHFGTTDIDEIHVMGSAMSSEGPRYSILGRAPL